MAPKTKAQLAREHLERALPAVSVEDHTEAVTWLFAALEAAIVALAQRHGLETPKQHWKKAEAAAQLHGSGVLRQDLSDTLAVLNEARKVAVYEGADPEFEGRSLESITGEVEAAVELAEREGAP